MPPKTSILLLKTKSTPQDGYDDFFTDNNYAPTFIPVLEHRFHGANLTRVRQLFASGAFNQSTTETTDNAESGWPIGERKEGRKYGGMIFTSQRAVEAFAKMIEEEGRMSCPVLFSPVQSSLYPQSNPLAPTRAIQDSKMRMEQNIG